MTLTRLTKLKNLFAVIALTLTLCYSHTAHSKDFPEDFHAGIAVGAGRQYSGIFGAQVFLGYKRARVHAGVGFLVFSAGADLALTKKLSAGVYNYVGFASPIGIGGHFTYHFRSAFSKGFSAGINVTRVSPVHSRDRDLEDYTEAMISVGYQF